jgi:acetyl-CoA C-acetyltransferase
MSEAYIYDSIRSPRGKGKRDGALHEVTAVKLSADMLRAIKGRNNLDTTLISDVIWGNVTQVGEQGGCLARSAVILADYDISVPGLSINRFCASGLEAINLAANQIRGGAGEAYIAGGVEMMSRVPMGSCFVPQGIAADIIATEFGFSRLDLDSYAVESHKRATNSWKNDRFKKSIVPIKDQNGLTILGKDELFRTNTTLETLGNLKPSFKEMGENIPGFDNVAKLKYPHLEYIEHNHHAGNSSGIVDGAAAILVGSKTFGKKTGLIPRARILHSEKIGTDPTIMLTGPVPVTERLLHNKGVKIDDIDLFEVNEAFSAVVLRFMQAFDLDHERVNVNGGAIALGHPLGATGSMILGTLLDEMERSDKGLGLATLCVASGMGSATLIELV